MAQLKDTIVSGNLRVTDTTLTDTLQVTTIKAPISSGGTTYGPGTSGQVLTSNGSSTYWGAANNHSHNYIPTSAIDITNNTDIGLDSAKNGFGYVNNVTKADWNYQQKDGVLIRQVYSNLWKLELYGDYRTGHLSVRGKNNGTWQNWLRILDEGNYTTFTYSSTASRTANTVLAAPNGSAGAATFRKLVAADLPDSYLPTSGGTVSGTLVLSKTQDASGTANNSPALIVGGAATSTHLELDANEIMAKTNGTSTAALYINNDGGNVYINNNLAARHTSTPTSGQVVVTDGTAGGIKSSGYTIAKSVPSNAKFTDENVKQTPTTSSNTSYRPVLVGMDYGDPGYTATEKTDAVYAVPRVMIKPSTGDLVLYSGGDADSPSLTFQRGTPSDGTYDWKLYVTGGHLNFNRNNAGTWTNLVQFEKTGKLYVSGTIYSNNTPVSLDGHTHDYLPTAGGTMEGNISFKSISGNTYPIASNKIIWNGGTDGIDIYYNLRASDAGELIMNMRDDPNVRISFAYNGTVKSYIDANGNFSGNAATSSSWATARTLTLGGQLTGSVSVKGDANMTLNGYLKNSFIYDGSANFASYAWHKFAEVTVSNENSDQTVTFIVSKSWNDVPRCSGILTAHIRTGETKVHNSSQFYWQLANAEIDPANFVFVYTNTANTSCKVELWYKQTSRWDGWIFTVLKEHNRASIDNAWTLYTYTGHGSASHTTGTDSYASSIAGIKNDTSGNATSADALNLTHSNELNFSKLGSTGHVWFGYRWNTHGTETSGGTTITKYKFGNANGAQGLAGIEANSLILPGGSGTTTLQAKSQTTDGTYLLPDCGNGTYTLSIGMTQVGGTGDSLVMSNVSGIPQGTRSFKIVFKSNASLPIYSMVEIPNIGDGVDCGGLIQVGDYTDGQQGSLRIVMKSVVIRVTAGSTTGTKTFTATVSPTQKISGSSVSEFTRNVIMYKIYACC